MSLRNVKTRPDPITNDIDQASYPGRIEAEGRNWGNHLKVEADGEWYAWLDHPLIAAHYAEHARIDGLPWEHWVTKALGGPAERSFDLGCGAGSRSIAVFQAGSTASIEGIDLSEERITEAERSRIAINAPGDLRVADANSCSLQENRYDLIFSAHSFHHFVELERIMEQVSQALTPRGLFVLEEFVGPTRFQWTDLQLEAVRLLLAMLPAGLRLFHPNLMSTMDEGRTEELASRLPFSIFPTPVAKATIRGLRRLRRSVNGRALERIKTAEGRPSPAEVIALSPFESIRSSEIAPLFRERFELVESRLLGGTIQHLLYNGVMHNFRAAADLGAQWITAVQRVEDAFIDSALLPSDFQLLVGRRRR
jgi:SAM-dependent methyltransferase